MTYYRFLSGTAGIYEAVDRDCPCDDARRASKPDGSWLPKVGPRFPGAISFWSEHGLRRYLDSGLRRWHQAVVLEPITVVATERIHPALHTDDFQVICTPASVHDSRVLSIEEFRNELANLPLHTPRLVLEPITEQHAEELCELFSDPELHHLVPFEVPTLVQQRERCVRWAKRSSPDGTEVWLNWAGRDRATGKIAAHFQAGIKAADNGVASIGYVVARQFQRQGVATEGLRAVFVFLREAFSVCEVKAWSDTRNTASHRLAKKLGMVQVDFIKDADFFKGSTSDEFVFSKMLE